MRKHGFIYWAPRVLSILFLLFLALFSLDMFGMGLGFYGTLLGLFMHNIPVFALTVLLVIAWRYEIVGAVAYFLAGALYITIVAVSAYRTGFEWYMLAWMAQISGFALLISGLFLAGWLKRVRSHRP